MASKPIITVDFDGVAHLYTSAWVGEDKVVDGPVPGFFDWWYKARDHFTIVIYSARSKSETGIEAMRGWFQVHFNEWRKDRIETITLDLHFASEKPMAFLTIDDRAIHFKGDWKAPELDPLVMKKFRPWNKQITPAQELMASVFDLINPAEEIEVFLPAKLNRDQTREVLKNTIRGRESKVKLYESVFPGEGFFLYLGEAWGWDLEPEQDITKLESNAVVLQHLWPHRQVVMTMSTQKFNSSINFEGKLVPRYGQLTWAKS